jgi:hypothetical protein
MAQVVAVGVVGAATPGDATETATTEAVSYWNRSTATKPKGSTNIYRPWYSPGTYGQPPNVLPWPKDNPNLWKEANELFVERMRKESRIGMFGMEKVLLARQWIYHYDIPEYSPSFRMTVEQKILVLGGDPTQAPAIDQLGCILEDNYYSIYGKIGRYPDGRYFDGAELPLYLRDRDEYNEELQRDVSATAIQMTALINLARGLTMWRRKRKEPDILWPVVNVAFM